MDLITGIQQIGIGTADAGEAALYYSELMGFTALVFDDVAEATLMTRYTGGKVWKRRAMLTMNMQGGGGLELWQYLDREPAAKKIAPVYGDLGIFAIILKVKNLAMAYDFWTGRSDCTVEWPKENVEKIFFWLTDKYGNVFKIVQSAFFFDAGTHVCGGVCGAVLGVSDLEKSAAFYKNIFGLELIIKSEVTERRKTLTLGKNASTKGAFSKLLGFIQIELVQSFHQQPDVIFESRWWGDLGFIHLCFDVLSMDLLKEKSLQNGNEFSVDSKHFFEMDKAGGRFCYVEDPDGTLIEMVETHKVPILKSWNWYLNLKKRKNNKPLTDWMIKIMGWTKVK